MTAKEKLEAFGYRIERVTVIAPNFDTDLLILERKSDTNVVLWTKYDFLNKKIYYGSRCFIGKDTTPGLSFEENKLILQYIEENEND